MKRYSNPWTSYQKPSLFKILTHLLDKSEPAPLGLSDLPAVHTPRFDDGPLSQPRTMWLGHASCYLQLPTADGGIYGILFDPIFSSRCSPIKFLGPKRRMPTPCRVEGLPVVNLLIISHDHYDHLDKATVLDIERYHPNVRYLVPTGVGRILTRFGVAAGQIDELGWWDDITPPTSTNSSSYDKEKQLDVEIPSANLVFPYPNEDEPPLSPASTSFSGATLLGDEGNVSSIVATCCPAQHNSGRGVLSHNSTLWASWYLTCSLPDGHQYRVFFGGDTGYRSSPTGPVCPIFREIKDRLGSPDLALLPIAAGACLPFIERLLHIKLDQTFLTRHLHSPPSDAVQAHLDLGARRSVGIHWGTFTTDEGARETRAEVERIGRVDFGTVDVGLWVTGGKDFVRVAPVAM